MENNYQSILDENEVILEKPKKKKKVKKDKDGNIIAPKKPLYTNI